MAKYLLITRPMHDDTTAYLHAWSKVLIDAATQHGFKVLNLEGVKAIRKNLESYSKVGPAFIVFNGHGDEKSVTGHNNEVLVKAGDNEAMLKESVVYSITCRSAKELGVASVNAGAKAYVGYREDFVFMVDKNKETRPLEDEIAGLFLSHSQTFSNSIIKGNSVGDSYEKAKNELFRNFTASLVSDPSMAEWLWWDYSNFVCLGDARAAI